MQNIFYWTGITLGILLGVLLVLFVLMMVVGRWYDRMALRAAKAYCQDHGLEYIEANAYPNHYGLYFKQDGKRHYASYDFLANRTISWKKGSPLEVAARKKQA